MVSAILCHLFLVWKGLYGIRPAPMEVMKKNACQPWTQRHNKHHIAVVVELTKCCCRKACKGVKGLKVHQRRCWVLESLDETPLGCEHSNSISDTTSSFDSDHEIDQSEAASFISPDTVGTKPGVYIHLRQTNNGAWQTTFSSKLSKILTLIWTMRVLIQSFI